MSTTWLTGFANTEGWSQQRPRSILTRSDRRAPLGVVPDKYTDRGLSTPAHESQTPELTWNADRSGHVRAHSPSLAFPTNNSELQTLKFEGKRGFFGVKEVAGLHFFDSSIRTRLRAGSNIQRRRQRLPQPWPLAEFSWNKWWKLSPLAILNFQQHSSLQIQREAEWKRSRMQRQLRRGSNPRKRTMYATKIESQPWVVDWCHTAPRV